MPVARVDVPTSAPPPHAHEPSPGPAIPERAYIHAAGLFRAAGDVARLRLLAQLQAGERCVTELAELAGASVSTVSQRLRVLRSEGLVVGRREGKHVYYTLADDHVAGLIANAIAHAAESGRAPAAHERSTRA